MSVLSVLNPVEIRHRATDSKIYHLMTEIFQAHNRLSADYFVNELEKDVEGVSLASADGKVFLEALAGRDEIREDTVNNQYIERIFLTIVSEEEKLALCFLPKSKSYQKNKSFTNSNLRAEIDGNCKEGVDCYVCLTTGAPVIIPSVTPTMTLSPTPNPDPCADFDPEWPTYPWTCNTSSRWAIYGCSHYCVVDLGCNHTSECPSGTRALEKRYHGIGADASTCLSHLSETSEIYCMPPVLSNCNHPGYTSGPSDFDHGCVDPVRPIKWMDSKIYP